MPWLGFRVRLSVRNKVRVRVSWEFQTMSYSIMIYAVQKTDS